jgi:hypothetical protein
MGTAASQSVKALLNTGNFPTLTGANTKFVQAPKFRLNKTDTKVIRLPTKEKRLSALLR